MHLLSVPQSVIHFTSGIGTFHSYHLQKKHISETKYCLRTLINNVHFFSSGIWNKRAVSVKQIWRVCVPHTPQATRARCTRKRCMALQDGGIWKENASETEKKYAAGKTGPHAGNEERKRWSRLDACEIRFILSWKRSFWPRLFCSCKQWQGAGKLYIRFPIS